VTTDDADERRPAVEPNVTNQVSGNVHGSVLQAGKAVFFVYQYFIGSVDRAVETATGGDGEEQPDTVPAGIPVERVRRERVFRYGLPFGVVILFAPAAMMFLFGVAVRASMPISSPTLTRWVVFGAIFLLFAATPWNMILNLWYAGKYSTAIFAGALWSAGVAAGAFFYPAPPVAIAVVLWVRYLSHRAGFWFFVSIISAVVFMAAFSSIFWTQWTGLNALADHLF
jgi:hypothetical protein